MNIILCKAGATLPPPPRQYDPNRIKNGCLPRVVRTDEYRCVAKFDIQRFYRTKILDLKTANTHGILTERLWHKCVINLEMCVLQVRRQVNVSSRDH